MGYSQIVPGASYEEPAMRAAVERLITRRERLGVRRESLAHE
jgi:hypothetical protein